MATVANTRKDLNVEGKVKVIWQTQNDRKKVDVCREFGVVNYTTHTIWKNRTKIIRAFEQNGSRLMRFRKTEQSDVDEALLKWLSQSEVTPYL